MRRALLALVLLASCLACVAADAPATGPTYVLYASPASRKLFASDALDLKARVNRWRDLVKARGGRFVIATHPQQLAQTPPATALILASAVALGEEERRVIQQRADAGEGLLATWVPGSIDPPAGVAPGRFVEEAFGVRTRPRAADERGFLVTVGDTPITHALAAGTRLWVGRDARFATPVLDAPGAGYLSDWGRGSDGSGLVAYTAKGASRRALLAWPETAWEGHMAEYTRLAEMALDWVEGGAIAYARGWPHPYRGAVTVGVDALWRFENLPRFGEALTRHGAHGSFHFLPADVSANANAIRDLMKASHGIGGFGDVARPFAGQSEAEQRARVERMGAGFRTALGRDFVLGGLRAPQGATDAATERAAATLDYVVDIGRVDAATPVAAANRRLVMLSAATNLDGRTPPEALRSGLAAALLRARSLGGYAFVGVDLAGFLPESALQLELESFLATAAKEGTLWLASATEVARWWRTRADVMVASTWDAKDALLTIDVRSAAPMAQPVAIAIASPPGRPRALLEFGGAQLVESPEGAVLVVRELAAGERRLRLRFVP